MHDRRLWRRRRVEFQISGQTGKRDIQTLYCSVVTSSIWVYTITIDFTVVCTHRYTCGPRWQRAGEEER